MRRFLKARIVVSPLHECGCVVNITIHLLKRQGLCRKIPTSFVVSVSVSLLSVLNLRGMILAYYTPGELLASILEQLDIMGGGGDDSGHAHRTRQDTAGRRTDGCFAGVGCDEQSAIYRGRA